MINACPYLKDKLKRGLGRHNTRKTASCQTIVDILSHKSSYDRELDLISSANQEARDVTDMKKCENSPKRVVIKTTKETIKV